MNPQPLVRWQVFCSTFLLLNVALWCWPDSIDAEEPPETGSEAKSQNAESEQANAEAAASNKQNTNKQNTNKQTTESQAVDSLLPLKDKTASERPADAVLFGTGHKLFFGVTPGTASQPVPSSDPTEPPTGGGINQGSTGLTNLAGDTQIGFAGYVGGAYFLQRVDPQMTIQLDANGRLSLALLNDKIQDGTGKTISLSIDRLYGEGLYYLKDMTVGPGFPVFAGAWGNMAGTTYSSSTPAIKDADSTTAKTIPFRLSFGAGIGRMYPIHWRIVVLRMEKVLKRDGVIEDAIPRDVADKILSQWHQDHEHLQLPLDPDNPYESAHHRHVLHVLQILKDAELLKKPVNMLTAYALERILLDEGNIDRAYGWDARAGLRISKTMQSTKTGDAEVDSDTPTSLGIEVMGRAVYNLSLESDIRIEPALGLAFGDDGILGNTLEGSSRVALDAAPATDNTPFIPLGDLVLDVPATYTRYVYDPSYNLLGTWNLYAGASLGYGADTLGLGAMGGGSYTFFTDSRTGYTLGANVGVGHMDDLVYQFNFIAAISMGTGESYYTAPDQVGDTVPFDSSWLPQDTSWMPFPGLMEMGGEQ